jgi:hypothetical protein
LGFNANEYMISYTCHSNADPRSGGYFYLAKYGIYVEQAQHLRCLDARRCTWHHPARTRRRKAELWGQCGNFKQFGRGERKGEAERERCEDCTDLKLSADTSDRYYWNSTPSYLGNWNFEANEISCNYILHTVKHDVMLKMP